MCTVCGLGAKAGDREWAAGAGLERWVGLSSMGRGLQGGYQPLPLR